MAGQNDFREVWFPGEFTTYCLSRGQIPNTYTTERGIVPVAAPRWEPPFDKTFSFPITRVVHMTHSPDKDEIWDDEIETAQFEPQSKYSRDTFKARKLTHNLYQYAPIYDGNKVLPGKYVWFGMKPSLPVDDDFEQHISDVEWASSEGSRYGPWVFDLLYRDLINIYKHRITEHHPRERVCFRNGGTLRYRNEICYVVIVTHTGDMLHLNNFPLISSRAKPVIFSEDLTTPPCFHPRCVPVTKKGYTWNELVDWDHVVFAVHCDWRGTFDIPGRSFIPLGEPYDLFDGVPFDKWERIHGLCVKTLPEPSCVCLQAEMKYRRCRGRRH